MFNVGTGELALILMLALIVLGPDKLPNAAREVGRYLAEFRRISGGFQQEFRDAVDAAMAEPRPSSRSYDTSSFSLPGSSTEVSLEKLDVELADDDDLATPLGAQPEALGQTPAEVHLDGPSSSFS